MTASLAGGESDTGAQWATLVEVSSIRLDELFAEDDGDTRLFVRRLLRSLDDPGEVISAFSSFVE